MSSPLAWVEPRSEAPVCRQRAAHGQEQSEHIHIALAVLPDSQRSFNESLHALLERKRRPLREFCTGKATDSPVRSGAALPAASGPAGQGCTLSSLSVS